MFSQSDFFVVHSKVTSGTGTLPPNMSLEIMELPKSFCYFNFFSYLCRQM